MQVSTSPIASVSPCLHGFQTAVARNHMVARLYSSSLFSGWTLSSWFCHDFGLFCGAVFFVFLPIECMPVFLCLKAARNVVRRCGVCRLDGHMAPRCPIKYRSNVKCGCKKRSCGRCSAACDVCKEVGHEQDNVDVLIQGGAAPRWSCSSFEMGAMQARLQSKLREIVPTVREQTNATRGHKRTLAEMTPKDGDRLDLHTRQSNFIDLTGLGGAAASPAVRTARRVAAVLQDEGSSHPAARAMGAFAADAAGHPTGGSAQAVPGPLGTAVEEGGRGATVLASLEEALKNAPKYSASTSSGARRRNKEAGLSGGRSLAVEEVLGSSRPFFHFEGKELKRAAQRYVAIPE